MILFIDHRPLVRDCLSRSLADLPYVFQVLSVPSIDDWTRVSDEYTLPEVVVLFSGAFLRGSAALEVEGLARILPGAALLIVCEGAEPSSVRTALEIGAKGIVPANATLEIAAAAIRLVKAGGTFIPASALLPFVSAAPNGDPAISKLTQRQSAIIDGIRLGKTNKQIACGLGLQESTVKVHIRNIMRKLNARNRTEICYIVDSPSAGKLIREPASAEARQWT